VTYVGRSDDFNVILELRNTADGSLVADSNGNTAGGTDESLNHTPTGTPLVLRVIADSPGTGGAFSVAAGQPTDADATIGPDEILHSSLKTTDAFDPIFLPDEYHKKDYALSVPMSFTGTVRVTLRSPDWATLDPYLSIVDALTGTVLAENDDIDFDGGDYDARIDYPVDPQRPVLIRASSAYERETGPFTLETSPL
jgi:hypothetical protein